MYWYHRTLIVLVLIYGACCYDGNRAISFNGTKGFISTDLDMVVDSEGNYRNELTIEAWVYYRDHPTGTGSSWCLPFSSRTKGPYRGPLIYVNQAFRYYQSDNAVIETDFIVPKLDWFHMALVYNGTSVRFYVNGVLNHATEMVLPSSVSPGDGSFQLGSWDVDYCDIAIDEFRVWEIARTAEEVMDNRDYALTGNNSGLLTLYNFDEEDGSPTVIDSSGLGYNGTLVDSVRWVDIVPKLALEFTTFSPTESPTFLPTGSPTFSPSESPTFSPTESPTFSPTGSPTSSPTESPSFSPTGSPTSSPTESPTSSPTEFPTTSPTVDTTDGGDTSAVETNTGEDSVLLYAVIGVGGAMSMLSVGYVVFRKV